MGCVGLLMGFFILFLGFTKFPPHIITGFFVILIVSWQLRNHLSRKSKYAAEKNAYEQKRHKLMQMLK